MRGSILLAGLLALPAVMASAQTGGSVAGTASAGVGGAVGATVNGTRTTTSDTMTRGTAGSGLRVDNRNSLVRPGASVGADAGGAATKPTTTGTGNDISTTTGATTPSAPPPR